MTTADLRADGRSTRWIAAACRAGDLARIRRGTFALPGACTVARRVAAHGGVAACVTAARELGIWVLDKGDKPHVAMGVGGHRRIHKDEEVADAESEVPVEAEVEPPEKGGEEEEEEDEEGCGCVEHWDQGEGMPVRRILRQILSCFGVEDFFVSLESALRLRLLSSDDRAWLRDHTNDAARAALEFARDDADSGLESLVRWRLRSHHLPVRTQVAIFTVGQVDLVIGDRLLIETDGKENHDDKSHRHRDLVRDAHAAVWGMITLRFDYAMVVHDWDLVESAILAHVRRGEHLSAA